jgi:hypothetical protein
LIGRHDTLTSQRVYLPSLYVFGGGITGELTPTPFEKPGQQFGAGLPSGVGLMYRVDELGMVGVEYNLVKDFVQDDPALNRLMRSAGIRLW